MSQHPQLTEVAPVRALSLWLAAIGFFMLAIGELLISWFPTAGGLEFTLQTVGLVLIAVGLLLEWRTHVTQRGWGALVFFFIALLAYAAVWFPYAFAPDSLGTTTATHRGFFTQGIGFICAAIGTFMVMRRKEAQLKLPTNSHDRQIKATFMELLLIGLGCLINGFSWIWVAKEDTRMAEFFLPVLGCLMILIAVVSAREILNVQVGRPAAVFIILGVFVFTLHWALDALPTWVDQDWRQSMRVAGVAFGLGGVACVLAAGHKAKAASLRLALWQ